MNMKKEYRKELREIDKGRRALARQARIDRGVRDKTIRVAARQYHKCARARLKELARLDKRAAILVGRLA